MKSLFNSMCLIDCCKDINKTNIRTIIPRILYVIDYCHWKKV